MGEFLDWLRSAVGDDGRPAIPAATVVLLREAPEGHGIETLMVKKASKIAFGGMWVFPGGRIDDADRDGHPDDDLAAAQVAAAREAAEEADLALDPSAMLPWSFWLPPAETPKRFATWFFLAPAPEGAVTVDGGEIRDHRWTSPAAMLAARERGEVELAPPTWVTLHQLTEFDDLGDAWEAAASRQPERYETRIATDGAALCALWEGDVAYHEPGDAGSEGPRHRLVMSDDGWRYLRSA